MARNDEVENLINAIYVNILLIKLYDTLLNVAAGASASSALLFILQNSPLMLPAAKFGDQCLLPVAD